MGCIAWCLACAAHVNLVFVAKCIGYLLAS